MAGNIIVGFAPALATGSTGKGAGLGAATEQADGPLGMFGALLGATGVQSPAALEFAVASETALEPVAGVLPAVLPLDVEFGLEAPAEPEVNGEALLAELVDALAALDQALANGEPVSPALTGKISETLDVLAALLGIALPAEAPADPAIEPAADLAGTNPLPARGDIDAFLGLAGAATPAPQSTGALAPAAPDIGPVPGPTFAAPSVPAPTVDWPPVPLPAPAIGAVITAEADPALPVPMGAPAAAAASQTAPASEPPPALAPLVEKITELARALEPHSPGLAKRLEALVQKLSSGEFSAQALAALGIDTDMPLSEDQLDQALTRLLSASSEVKGTPAPQAFAAAQLKLPEVMALPPKAESPARPQTTPISAPMVPEAEPEVPPEPAPPLTLEPKPAEPQDRAQPRPVAQSVVGDAVKSVSAKAEAPIEPAPAPQPAVQPAAVAATIVAGTKAIHAAYQAPVQQINIPQVAFEVVRQVVAGNSRFQIRLDPPELGRIDVKLDVDQSGNVNARMTVERSETLDLMQRDQRALERALAQAGLDSSKTNLEFSLRQNPFGREDGGDGRGKDSPFGGGSDTAGPGEDVPEITQTQYRGSTSASGVNLFV